MWSDEMYKSFRNTERYLFAEKIDENTPEQNALIEKCLKESLKHKDEEWHFERI